MSLDQVLTGLIVAAVVAVIGLVWQWVDARRARRHARSTIPPPATELRWDQDAEGDPPASSLPPDYVEQIRRDAEDTARYVHAKGIAEPPNPYPGGSREFVLWAASFHMTMTELEELLGETHPSSDPMPLENPPPHAQRPHTQPPSVPPGISRQ